MIDPLAMLEDAEVLVSAKERFYRINCENAERDDLTGNDLQRAIEAHAVVDELCEVFRRAYYPRAAEVICAGGTVMVCSPTRRRVRTVFDEQYGRTGSREQWGSSRHWVAAVA